MIRVVTWCEPRQLGLFGGCDGPLLEVVSARYDSETELFTDALELCGHEAASRAAVESYSYDDLGWSDVAEGMRRNGCVARIIDL